MSYTEDDDVQIVSLPYAGKPLSMVVVLPKKVDGLSAVEKSLDAKKLQEWMGAMGRRQPPKVDLSLPKFTFRAAFELNKQLVAMGMSDAFKDDGSADFSGMCTGTRLYISAVVHQAFIDVGEEGTEAAAATAVDVHEVTAMPPPPQTEPIIIFKADHPFLFFIQDIDSGAILFVGRMANPKA
jgi:serpin B